LHGRLSGVDIGRINGLTQAEFIGLLGGIFENSPWVAEQAWHMRPFDDLDAIHQGMAEVAKNAPREWQLRLLRSHPDLAGREAQEGKMTDSSTVEQASAGLNALSRAEMDEINQLNAEYRRKHGFPFIIAVREHTKPGIFMEFRRRLGNNTETEVENALQQIFAITLLRIRALECT